MPRARPGDLYLDELSHIRSLPGTRETSFYPAVANLLNQVGGELRPKVYCLHHPVDARARTDRFLAWRKANPGKPDVENPHAWTGTSYLDTAGNLVVTHFEICAGRRGL